MPEWFAALAPLLAEPPGQLLHALALALLYSFCEHTVQLGEDEVEYVPASQVAMPITEPMAAPPVQ
jgi:hypothetical protein